MEQRNEALNLLAQGMSLREVGKKMKVGKSTIDRIKKRKDDINESEMNPKRKHSIPRPKFMDIEEIVVRFFHLARERGTSVTGPMLKQLAEEEASIRKGVLWISKRQTAGLAASKIDTKYPVRHCVVKEPASACWMFRTGRKSSQKFWRNTERKTLIIVTKLHLFPENVEPLSTDRSPRRCRSQVQQEEDHRPHHSFLIW